MNVFAYITAPDKDTACSLARLLVEAQLAAGVNIGGPAFSVYRWQGKIHEAEEWLLFVQTTQENFHNLEKFVKQRHPYHTPCIIAMEIKAGEPDFMDWIRRGDLGGVCHHQS